jgi:Domain of unknown function (DUF4832)
MNVKTAISILAVTQVLSSAPALPHDLAAPRGTAGPQTSAPAPQCVTIGTDELTITCAYKPDSGAQPRISLNRAAISFAPSEDSQMSIELTFTNDRGSAISGHRDVYLVIDDENGKNNLRRLLPHVDFTKLEPGKPAKFQEVILAPGFAPGTYTISLWIPSTDPSLKFDAPHNFLLGSEGVADPATGLNQIAKFTVPAKKRRSSKPD